MADKRISQLVERTDIENNDVLPIVASGATTTNKVTISTIQDWMQDNLDVGVTSVGITLGTTGTDVNVTGSPITTSGNITINIPTASATNRGLLSSADWSTFNNKQAAGNYVTTDTNQSITGFKSFANGFSLATAGGTNQATTFKNIGTIHEGSAGSNQIGFNNSNNIYFGKGLSNGGVIQWTNAAVRYYTLPDADGTIALASDLTGYVTLGTAQTITGSKTFNSRIIGQDASLTGSGSADTLEVAHTSGSGIAVDISKAGNGEGLRVAKTSGSGNAVTITGGALSAVAGQFSGDLQSSTRVIAAVSGESIVLTPNLSSASNRIESAGALPLALVSAATITMASGGTTPQITLATSGNVGIGSDSPLTNLQVGNGTQTALNGAGNKIHIATNGTRSALLTLANSSGGTTVEGQFESSAESADLRVIIGSSSNHPVVFRAANTEAMRITSGGNVLVNNNTDDSSGAKLQVTGRISQSGLTYYKNQDAGNLSGSTWITTGVTLAANHLGSYEVYVNGNENGQNQCTRIYMVFYNIYTGWGAALVSTTYIGNDYGWVDIQVTSGGTIQVRAANSVSTGLYRVIVAKQFTN
jgi:hypothetical protein